MEGWIAALGVGWPLKMEIRANLASVETGT